MGRAFSFAEVVTGRDASVPVTDDNLLHAVPLIVVVQGCDSKHASQVNLEKKIVVSRNF
jgi:hypothetical protein